MAHTRYGEVRLVWAFNYLNEDTFLYEKLFEVRVKDYLRDTTPTGKIWPNLLYDYYANIHIKHDSVQLRTTSAD